MLMPTSRNTSNGRLALSSFEVGLARVSVAGAVFRGVAVAPRMPPDGLGDGAGVPCDGDGVGDGDEAGLAEEPGDELGEEPGDELGDADGGGLPVGHAGTVAWSTVPSENAIR